MMVPGMKGMSRVSNLSYGLEVISSSGVNSLWTGKLFTRSLDSRLRGNDNKRTFVMHFLTVLASPGLYSEMQFSSILARQHGYRVRARKHGLRTPQGRKPAFTDEPLSLQRADGYAFCEAIL